MGLSKETPDEKQDHEDDVSHGDIMALLKTMREEQRAFRKEVNAKIDAIEVHNLKQDANLARGARHMADTDADLGMLAQYMNSTQAVQEAHAVYERACARMKSSSAFRHMVSPQDTPTNPSNLKPTEEDLPDTIPPPSRVPDTER